MKNTIILILAMMVSSAAASEKFNVSIFIQFTSPDGQSYEIKTRKVLASGVSERLISEKWGLSLTIEDLFNDEYELQVTVLEKAKIDGRTHWAEYSSAKTSGKLGALLEFESKQGATAIESAFFVSKG